MLVIGMITSCQNKQSKIVEVQGNWYPALVPNEFENLEYCYEDSVIIRVTLNNSMIVSHYVNDKYIPSPYTTYMINTEGDTVRYSVDYLVGKIIK